VCVQDHRAGSEIIPVCTDHSACKCTVTRSASNFQLKMYQKSFVGRALLGLAGGGAGEGSLSGSGEGTGPGDREET